MFLCYMTVQNQGQLSLELCLAPDKPNTFLSNSYQQFIHDNHCFNQSRPR